jgi:hypothetical protein
MRRNWGKPAVYLVAGIMAWGIAEQANALFIHDRFAPPQSNLNVSQAIVQTPIYQNSTPTSTNNTGLTLVTGGSGGGAAGGGSGSISSAPEPSALLLIGTGLLGLGWQLRKRPR